MIRHIPARERYRFENDWLQTYWLFSFDHYYDPNNVSFGPLRVFNDDVIAPRSGFPMHPHREMEIVTYVLRGELTHEDSLGNRGVLSAGDVQRMSAGTGIVHSEWNHGDEPVHLLQIWVLPERRGIAPGYEQRSFSREERTNRLLPVVSGLGHDGTLRIHQAAAFYVSRLEAGQTVTHTLADGRRAFLYVIDGGIDLNGVAMGTGDQARIEAEEALSVAAREDTELILIDLP